MSIKIRAMRRKGVVLVELLLAFAIWTIFLSGLVPLWFSLNDSGSSLRRYAREESLWSLHLYSEQYTDPTYPIFLMKKYLDREVFSLTDKVTQNFALSTLVFDWKNAFGHSSCRGLDLSKGKIVSLPIEFHLDEGSVATDMKARGGYLYMTADSATSTDADFYILDIKDPDNPTLVSKLDTGPGLRALYLAGYAAYVANSSINSQAQALQIYNPADPRIAWSFKVPGTRGTSTSIGKAIASDGSRLYLGTEKSTFPELFVIDTLTHQEVAHAEIGAAVNGLYLDHSSLYVATPQNPELSVFAIPYISTSTYSGTSSVLSLINKYEAPGSTGNGKSIDIVNDNAYLGRTLGGNELIELRIGTSSLDKAKDVKIGSTVDGIISSKYYAYILTGNSLKEFQIWHRDPSAATWSLSSFLDLPSRGVALACAGNRIFIALGTNSPIVEIIDE